MYYGKIEEDYILACYFRYTGHYNSSIIIFYFKLNILPTTYAVMVGMILVLLGFISFALMKPNKKEHHHKTKPREIIGKVLSLLLSVLRFLDQ